VFCDRRRELKKKISIFTNVNKVWGHEYVRRRHIDGNRGKERKMK